MSALFLQAASSAALGLRRLTSENLDDSPQVMVSALLVSASRHDAALEQIIGRMSLEPFDMVVRRQAEQAARRAEKSLLAARVRRNLPLQSRRDPEAGEHRHEVTIRRLHAGVSGSPDRNSQGARGRLRAPDDLCRSGDAKDLDETGHLVEQVSASVVLASFSQDDHGDKAGRDLLNPAGVFQDAICCGHQTTHPSK